MDIRQNLERVEKEIESACVHSGRRRRDVLLLAVSKFQPASAIAEAARLGQRDFGENYVQEALAKRTELAALPCYDNLLWHMTGHIQSRKAPLVAGFFRLIHTLDSINLANALEKALQKQSQQGNDMRQRVLLEINIASEPQKAGIMPQDIEKLATHVLRDCPNLLLEGLMCLPPVFDSGETARPYFAKLRELRDNLEIALGLKLPQLSMGMSGDFAGAIAEGATIVRIGTAIFGARPAKATI